jgi:hypothetical protein
VHPQTLVAPPPPHVCGVTQPAPHAMFVPQPLGTDPQFCPAGQLAAVGVHPHTLAAPPPPHEFEPLQGPQSSDPPHPFAIAPQFLPCCAQVVGVHPQTFAVPAPPHVCGAVQPAQCRTAPQPSLMSPQWLAHVSGTQGFAPHLLGPPPPQFGPAALPAQVPQSYVFPQPSGTVPQFAVRAAQFFG